MDYAVQWFYMAATSEDGDDPVMIYTKDYKQATGTHWVFTDTLEDGTEFGLAVTETAVSWIPSEYIIEQITSAFDSYREENGP